MISLYNLIEYSDNYSKISEDLRQYYIDEPNATYTDSESFKSKVKITGSTLNYGNKKMLKQQDHWNT